MKAQLIPFVFIVLLIAGVVTGYVFYNTFFGSTYQLQIFNIRLVDVARNVIENFKAYLQLALSLSVHQTTREHACVSGSVGAGPWICNGPNPLSVSQSKSCMEKYTNYYLNVYSDMFNVSLPVLLSKGNFTECVYDIDESDVFSGKYDEGNFRINCSGGKIAIKAKNVDEFEWINRSEFLTNNRYWYLFRNFYEWAMDDVFTPCICEKISCACSSISGEHVCTSCKDEAKECAQRALEDLQRRFTKDQYIVCEKKELCCAQGRDGCGPPRCVPWLNTICISSCTHRCDEPPPSGPVCPDIPNLETYLSSNNLTKNETLADTLRYWWCPIEARFAAGYEFWCTDHKYYVSTKNGPRPLVFHAQAIAFLRRGVCWW